MEEGLLGQLGINWKLLLSQTVNFFVLLLVLSKFVYLPLLKVMKARDKRIREGLEKAEQADVRLKEVDAIAKGKIKEADAESIVIIRAAEQRANALEQSLKAEAEARQKEIMHQIALSHLRQEEFARQGVLSSAAELVKSVVAKTVALDPSAIDEALIEKAISHMKSHEI